MKIQATQKTITKVLTAMLSQCFREGDDGKFYRRFYTDEINQLCNNAGDAFGTEGQDDPRGDQRG